MTAYDTKRTFERQIQKRLTIPNWDTDMRFLQPISQKPAAASFFKQRVLPRLAKRGRDAIARAISAESAGEIGTKKKAIAEVQFSSDGTDGGIRIAG